MHLVLSQFFARLNTTGELDSVTLDLMSRPRCGVPDVSQSGYRNKRYNLQGERWSRTNLTWALEKGPEEGGTVTEDVVRRELAHALEMWAR